MDIPVPMAPGRFIPWNTLKHYCENPRCDTVDVPFRCTEALTTMHKGELLIRDNRAAHSGPPNFSEAALPFHGMQMHTPQYLMWEAPQRAL